MFFVILYFYLNFRMRYYEEGGPIFLDIEGYYVFGPKFAYENKGAYLIAAHRYFRWDDTYPTDQTEKLKWLTTE